MLGSVAEGRGPQRAGRQQFRVFTFPGPSEDLLVLPPKELKVSIFPNSPEAVQGQGVRAARVKFLGAWPLPPKTFHTTGAVLPLT